MLVDLRSDTITQPTPAMRDVIARAPVGDDVYGEDPTVNALEAAVAALLGKEAAVFMPSGTMTNQIALRCHTEPGDEILLESQAHIYNYEGGGPAALSGATCRLIPGVRGIFTAADLERALRPESVYFPRTKLVCLENTHNRGGGSIYPLPHIRAIARCCHERGLKLHLDGARLWNACVATGISEAEYAAPFDTASVCFSKGLGAPVGSALAGSREAIARARRFRKMFGGGMRQAGTIAAGALYALEHHRERLQEDHLNAKLLAEGLHRLDGVDVDLAAVQTNIVKFRVPSLPAWELAADCAEKGVRVLAIGADSFRAVTHLMVSREQVLRAPSLIAAAIADFDASRSSQPASGSLVY